MGGKEASRYVVEKRKTNDLCAMKWGRTGEVKAMAVLAPPAKVNNHTTHQ